MFTVRMNLMRSQRVSVCIVDFRVPKISKRNEMKEVFPWF